ncbi:MAG: acyl-CoA dehydrogenase [Gammaproteobacteria bacterium]|nr:acyl-CoA dehydrogenase [Gammaproteobacteria bacterium]MYD80851.1 acyl-CoA dehydrogenase [Gammaproteobacteria bacterium]
MAPTASNFRAETREWLLQSCPSSLLQSEIVPKAGQKTPVSGNRKTWLERAAERGFTVPMWPKEFGGAGLSKDQYVTLLEEMRSLGIPAPLAGMGTTMLGPTLLEHGTEDQKARHLPRIARGEVRWCQGYSEPGSGSDLASLQTRAVDEGDHFVINGQKIWTSGAQYADWIFCLVRTDPDAPKHEGISFLLFSMHQQGVTVKPIRLISGISPFCETFFDDAIAAKEDVVGGLNKGWTVAKRLLQHERSGMNTLASGRNRESGPSLDQLARKTVGLTSGKIANADLRKDIVQHSMNAEAFRLTQRRTVEESQGSTPGPQTSIFKYYGANLRKERSELQVSMLGTDAFEWNTSETSSNRAILQGWLAGKAGSIAGGSNEIQLNIIAKRVLGLPD